LVKDESISKIDNFSVPGSLHGTENELIVNKTAFTAESNYGIACKPKKMNIVNEQLPSTMLNKLTKIKPK
jgi:hypothetical protein